jgi:hypothetical protein
MGSEDLVMTGRLSLAALLGGLVGLDRNRIEEKNPSQPVAPRITTGIN